MRRLLFILSATALLAPTIVHADDDQPLTIATVSSESHLPAWVQTVVAHASLFQADSASDQAIAPLSRHTFLRVIDGGTSRLLVQAYDAQGDPAQTGWVDPDQVEPSAPAIDWLVNSTAATLWSADGASAEVVRQLDRYMPLQKIDGPILNRILVRVYRADFSGVADRGWVDVSDIAPALPPQVRVPATMRPSVTAHRPAGSEQQQAFLDSAGGAARRDAALTHVPASVTVAQAILESDWGRSGLAQDANNYFGMKVMGTLGNDGLVYLPTSEYDDSGTLHTTVCAFRAYKSLADSTADHDELLATASRYALAMQVADDPRQFAAQIAQDGYSSDPDYADKLVDLMDRYDLYQLDR